MLSLFCSDCQMASESMSRDGMGMVDCATVAIPTMDGDSAHVACQGTASDNKKEECTVSAMRSRGKPHPETHKIDGMSLIRQQLRDGGISTAGTDIIMTSWRPATAKQNRPHVTK